MIAPAVWAYYFLDEHGQHTNTELLTYFVAAALAVHTGGTSLGAAIELSALGASFAAHVAADYYPNNPYVQDFAVAIDVLTMATILMPADFMAIGYSKIPWITVTIQESKKVYTFIQSEFSDFIRLIRNYSGAIDNAVESIGVLIDRIGKIEMVVGAKQQFLTYLLYAKLNLEISRYAPASTIARLAVNSDKLQAELYTSFGTHVQGDLFDLGDLVKGESQVYLKQPKLYNTALHGEIVDGGVLLTIDNIPVMDNGQLVNKSYEVVYTSFHGVYLAEAASHPLSSFSEFVGCMGVVQGLILENKLTHQIGNANLIELAAIYRYTVNGDILLMPMRNGNETIIDMIQFSLYQNQLYDAVIQGLAKLRQTDRLVTGTVYRGRTYSLDDFNTLFMSGNENVPLKGFVSCATKESVAVDFLPFTGKNITGPKVRVILRIKSKNGVYIDDFSDWGLNLVEQNHPGFIRQYEVLLEEGMFKIIGRPVLIKTENGVPWYEVNLEELGIPLRTIN